MVRFLRRKNRGSIEEEEFHLRQVSSIRVRAKHQSWSVGWESRQCKFFCKSYSVIKVYLWEKEHPKCCLQHLLITEMLVDCSSFVCHLLRDGEAIQEH
eukprot:g5646.t1